MEVRFTLFVYAIDDIQRSNFISNIRNSFDVYFRNECDQYNYSECEIVIGSSECLKVQSRLLPYLRNTMAVIDIDYDGEGEECVFVRDGNECDEIEFYETLLDTCPGQALLAALQRNNLKIVSAALSMGMRVQSDDEFVIKLALQSTLRMAKIILKYVDYLDEKLVVGVGFSDPVRRFVNGKYSLNIKPRKSVSNQEISKSSSGVGIYNELEKVSEDMVCTILEKRGAYPFLIDNLDSLLKKKRYRNYNVDFSLLAKRSGMVNEYKLRKLLMDAGVSIDFSKNSVLWKASDFCTMDFASFRWILSERINRLKVDHAVREYLSKIACIILSECSWLDSTQHRIKIDKEYLLKLIKSSINTLLYDSGFIGEICRSWSDNERFRFQKLTKVNMVDEILSYDFDWLPYEQLLNEKCVTCQEKLEFLFKYIDLHDSKFVCVLSSYNYGEDLWGYLVLIDELDVDVVNNGGDLKLLESAILFKRYPAVQYLLGKGLNIEKTFLNNMTLSDFLDEYKCKNDKVMVKGKKFNYLSLLKNIFKEHGYHIS